MTKLSCKHQNTNTYFSILNVYLYCIILLLRALFFKMVHFDVYSSNFLGAVFVVFFIKNQRIKLLWELYPAGAIYGVTVQVQFLASHLP